MRIAVVFLLGLLTACVHPPETREEHRAGVAKGVMWTKADYFTADQSLDRIVDLLSRKSAACLNKYYEGMDRIAGHQTRTKYTANVVKIRPDYAEFTFRVRHSPAVEPHDGIFLLAVDLTAVGKKKTKVDFYPINGYKDIFSTIKTWSQGQDAPCPTLPGSND